MLLQHLQQCWNIYLYLCAPYFAILQVLRCNRKLPRFVRATSSLNLEKFRYGRKRVRSFVHHFFFLHFPVDTPGRTRVMRARAIVLSQMRYNFPVCSRSPRNEQRIGSFFRVSLVRCRAPRDIAETLEKYTLSKYIYTHPAKEMISSFRKVRVKSLQCACNLVQFFSVLK